MKDPARAQRSTALSLVTNGTPGLSRRRGGGAFSYVRASGLPVRDPGALERIRKLAIPPAWTDVWIAADPRAHIQATGRDARTRKQYRYHDAWSAERGEEKYGRLAAFARALPGMRAQLRRHLKRTDASREQVLALLVTLLEATFIRVGNQEYRRANGSYGLTTLEDRHVAISGSRIQFSFCGKGGKDRLIELRDRRLARLVKQCRDLRGAHLFQYVDAKGHRRPAHSGALNAYLDSIADGAFTAKDFRTWGATLTAARLLDAHDEIVIGVPGKTAMLRDVATVALELGNTPAICRKSYIHPYLLCAYQDEAAWIDWRASARGRAIAGLDPDEARLLRFLKRAGTGSRKTAAPGGAGGRRKAS